MKEEFVNMGQIGVMSQMGILTTVGLGSCVGVTLHDSVAKVGAMGHVFLPRSRNKNDELSNPGKYADTAIPALIHLVVSAGGNPGRLVAKIAGGAHLFAGSGLNSMQVGSNNVKAVIKHLKQAKIPIIGQDVAGTQGRKMRLFVETGVVEVTTIGKESKTI